MTEPNYIYLDNAATTPLCEPAKKIIEENIDYFYNPSSIYEKARELRYKIENARAEIAGCINADPSEIYFTSGGSEANSWVNKTYGLLGSNIEHSSLVPNVKYNIDSNGVANLKEISNTLDKVLMSGSIKPIQAITTMMVNNEIGTIQPIYEVAKYAHKHNLLFHTDAVQAVGHIPINVKTLHCDFLSASAHKFGGLKGTGFLYIKKGTKINPLIYGGSQECGIRGGTENVLGILSMATALTDAYNKMNIVAERCRNYQTKIYETMTKIDGVHLNGSLEDRTCFNLNFSIEGISGIKLVALLDTYNIAVSTGSACHEGTANPSHVLKAIGLSDKEALSSIRITLGYQNTWQDIDRFCELIPMAIYTLRKFDE